MKKISVNQCIENLETVITIRTLTVAEFAEISNR